MKIFHRDSIPLEKLEELGKDLERVTTIVSGLRAEKKSLQDINTLEAERQRLTKELADLQISFGKEKEKHDREKRETEHLVGLQKKRGEFEVQASKREAILDVREEHLKAATDALEQRMKFMQEQFDKQFDSLNDLMEKCPRNETGIQSIAYEGLRPI